jgi:hypothetical protein
MTSLARDRKCALVPLRPGEPELGQQYFSQRNLLSPLHELIFGEQDGVGSAALDALRCAGQT